MSCCGWLEMVFVSAPTERISFINVLGALTYIFEPTRYELPEMPFVHELSAIIDWTIIANLRPPSHNLSGARSEVQLLIAASSGC